MIDGVKVHRIGYSVDERGRLAELFRADDPEAVPFGQVNVTTVQPGAIKAWHRHAKRTDQLVVLHGVVRLGLYDARPGSNSENEINEFFLGDHSPQRVLVPPGVWFGMKGVGASEALILVLMDEPYDPRFPDEERMDPVLNEIPFDWERRDR